MTIEPTPAPEIMAATRPLYWSVRRELWENRSTYIAPLIVAAVMLFGFWISTIGMPHRRRALLQIDQSRQRIAVEQPYDITAGVLIITAGLVGAFYCLDALHGERRDRSILFWKSLPVSDLTTVLSKASIPLVVLPLIIFAMIVVLHTIMAVLSTAILTMSGLSLTTIWPQYQFIPSPLALLYALAVMALWHAPIYAWLLLVSAWVRRAAVLWAVLPLFAIAVFEWVTFRTTYFLALLRYRLVGWLGRAMVEVPRGTTDALSRIDPVKFLATPGLWIGLIFAAACLAAAVRLRKYREPI